ncbi:YjgP/YjgQ family permease [Rhodocytophaga rosea]|uniref:YjgP/YjgQ family permease n=1 Tax=Rhodocytophaga rosea TaxID=2704465 RepID=A0A6C0GDD8_9BACT|nr:LptF/LptG family permease [Rhodocytophaga rosea]QHT65823.1 YjgP/YjgQ family permease [Rhodocytophaga rosea]
MKKIDKLILKSFVGPFFLTFFVVVFILLTQTMIKYFDEFVGKDLGFAVFAELLFYFSLNTTPVALPLAMLLSSLICFGNLGEHYELTAIKSSGISLIRVLVPVSIFAFLLTFVAFWFNNNIVPKANLNAYSLLWDVRQKKPSLDIKEGVFYNGLTGYSIKANKKLSDGKTLMDVMIYDHREGDGNKQVILADSAKMYTINNDRYLVLELFRGNAYTDVAQEPRRSRKEEFQRDAFDQSKMVFSLASFDLSRTDKSLFATSKYMMSVDKLQTVADSMKKEYALILDRNDLSVKQYYFNSMKGLPPKLDSLEGKWLDSLKHRALAKEEQVQVVNSAAAQARNVKNFAQSSLQQLDSAIKESRTFEVEKYKKFTQSLACFIMFLIGAPLGAIIKKGGLGVPVLVSIVFFIIFYVCSLLGEKWAREGIVMIPYGVWAANAILFVCGIFFLRQAKNDSRLFEADVYKVAFNRFRDKLLKMNRPKSERKVGVPG